MILNDELLYEWAETNIQPFPAGQINPASLDLRLGNLIRETHPIWDTMTKAEMLDHIKNGTIETLPMWGEPQEFGIFWLLPGRFVLCHSEEYIYMPNNAAGFLFSKSSTGRIGLEHLHAGHFDPSFSGQATWELHNIAPWPIKLTAGKRLMQMVMLEMIKPPRLDYSVTGRYNGQTGPTPAR